MNRPVDIIFEALEQSRLSLGSLGVHLEGQVAHAEWFETDKRNVRLATDYQPLHPGEPMFLLFDGTAMPYTGSSAVYPVFINEAAYYEKNIALYLTQKQTVMI